MLGERLKEKSKTKSEERGALEIALLSSGDATATAMLFECVGSRDIAPQVSPTIKVLHTIAQMERGIDNLCCEDEDLKAKCAAQLTAIFNIYGL